jgi:hypothetical protein
MLIFLCKSYDLTCPSCSSTQANISGFSAASAVAANIMLRSVIAAGFPLFTRQMFSNLGIQWAGTLLGCIAAVMIPIPIIFWFYGAALRQKSRVMAEDN